MPARIFVSSVVEEYQEYRAATRRGIEAAECESVLVNEDFPALARSPRNACLDAVASCDAYSGILGARAGYVAASGRTVVEEEYEEALRRELPVLIFVQEEVSREPRQQEFVDRVSRYVDGRYRTSFRTPDELEKAVRHAVERLELGVNEDSAATAAAVGELLERGLFTAGQRPTLRTAFVPLRNEEVVDPRALEDRLPRIILDVGHRADVELLSYASAYRHEVVGDALRVLPADRAGTGEPHSYAAIEMTESGRLFIEANVTDLVARGRHGYALAIVEEDVQAQLRRTFALAAGIFEEIDPYERQHSLGYNAGLFNIGYQTLIPAAQVGSSTTMRLTDGPDVVAHREARFISRRTLRDPDEELERTMTRFRRRLAT